MDEQQAPQQAQASQSEPPVPTPAEPTPLIAAPEQAMPVIATKPRRSKKLAKTAIIVLALLAVAAGVWWFTEKPKKVIAPAPSAPVTETQKSAKVTPEVAKVLTPNTVAYAFTDTAKTKVQLFWRPAAGGERTVAADLAAKTYLTYSAIYQNQVIATADGKFEGKVPATIYYSSDGGKSYTKLYTGPTPVTENDIEQVTSVKFSNDGTAIVFGDLPTMASKNTVKEVDIKTKAVKDLFTVPDLTGVFIKGYDRSAKKLYYFTGCYDCDGGTTGKLYVRDLATGKDTTAYEAAKGVIGVEDILNTDFTKLLVLRGVQGDVIGATGPYTLEEYDMATKAAVKIAEITTVDTSPIAGYSTTGVPYYVQDKALYSAAPGGKPSLLFQATTPIIGVTYVGKDMLVLSSGKPDNYQLTNYTISTKATVKIFDGDSTTRLFGVTEQ